VPVSGLNYWLVGRAAPNSRSDENFRPDGLLESLEQDGWLIRYTDYMQSGGMQLPRRLVLGQGDLEIRVAVDRWTIPEENAP
ncbi:MAG: hypothetical protein H0U63_00150, partial [Burkholderiales bacterium]|nr:hypothetical protein [Burkholderiales bacterium]